MLSSNHVAERKKAVSVITSPSDWSYDAPLRCLFHNAIGKLQQPPEQEQERAECEREREREAMHADTNTNNANANTRTVKHSYTESPNNQFYCNSQHRSSSILTLLSTVQFGPSALNHSDDSGSDSFGSSELGTESDTHSSDSDALDLDAHSDHPGHRHRHHHCHTAHHGDHDENKTYLVAAILLLCSSGVLDAAHIAYVTWLYDDGAGVSISCMLLVQGIAQSLICLLFVVITAATLICNFEPAMTSSHTGKRVTLKSLLLPCSMAHTIHFVALFQRAVSGTKHRVRRYKIMHQTSHAYAFPAEYGSCGDSHQCHQHGAGHAHAHTKAKTAADTLMTTSSLVRILAAVFVFGMVACSASWMFVAGYYLHGANDGDGDGGNPLAPLLCSATIAVVFLYSHFRGGGEGGVNAEQSLCLLLLLVGVFLCGMDTLRWLWLWLWNVANVYLVAAAMLHASAFVLVKCVSKVPTFILVLSQSMFSLVLGFVLYHKLDPGNARSVYDILRISSSALLAFTSSWTFVRGTQLIAATTAVFLRVSFLTLSLIVIQACSAGGSRPRLFGAFGIAFIALSVVLLLIEKFGQTRKSVR